MADKFSAVMNELLVEKVRKHPILFDGKNKNYKDQGKKDRLWEYVGKLLKITGSLRGEGDKEICPICIDEIVNDRTVTQCKHFFHAECILPVIASGGKCPLCRAYLKIDPPKYSTCSTKRKHNFKRS